MLFGNEAIVFVAERFEMFKAIMTLLGTASGATTRTSTSALSRKGSPSAASAYGGAMHTKVTPPSGFVSPTTHMVESGAAVRECIHHLKRVNEMSELLLTSALHAVNGHSHKQKKRDGSALEGNVSVRRALFLEKGSSDGGVGILIRTAFDVSCYQHSRVLERNKAPASPQGRQFHHQCSRCPGSAAHIRFVR